MDVFMIGVLFIALLVYIIALAVKKTQREGS